MAALLNRAKMTTATTGTGTVTLGSASTGYLSFAEAGAVNATSYAYLIEDGDDFEFGDGTYTSSGTTFSRDTVTASKISGTAGTTKIALSGAATIAVVPKVADLVGVDGTLAALAAYNTNGLLTQTAADTFTGRSITAGSGISVTNGNGVSGNPTVAVDVNGLTEDTAPDVTNDFTISYDASAGAHKKVQLRKQGGLVYLNSGTVSTASTLDIVLTAYTAYRGLVIMLSGFRPATDGVGLYCRFSTDGGTNFATTGYNYANRYEHDDGSGGNTGSGSAAQILMTPTAINVGNGSTEGVNCTVELLNQTSAAFWSRIHWKGYGISNVATPSGFEFHGGGSQETAQDTDAIRFLFSSGNITSGNWAIYGFA